MNRWLLSFLLAALSLLAVGWPPRFRVDSPRTGRPLSHSPAAPVRMEATTSLPFVLPAEARKAWLEHPDARVSWRLNRVTVDISPRDLPKNPGRIRLVFAADLAPPSRAALLDQFVMEMEKLHPDAVLLGGDLTYEESETWYAAVEQRVHHLERLGIPVIVAAGNHERKGWYLFQRHFGHVPTHRVDLDDIAILTLDSGHGRDQLTPSQLAWLEEQLRNLGGRSAVIQLHHPVWPAGKAIHGEAGGSGGSLMGFQKAFVALCRKHSVAAVLSGHWHSDAVFDDTGNLRDDTPDFPGTRYIVTTALGNQLRRITRWPHTYYGYRILDFEHGKLVRYTHDLNGDGSPDPIASTPLSLPPGLKEFPR